MVEVFVAVRARHADDLQGKPGRFDSQAEML